MDKVLHYLGKTLLVFEKGLPGIYSCNVTEKMTKFSYLGNVLSSGRGVQEVVYARISLDGKSLRI